MNTYLWKNSTTAGEIEAASIYHAKAILLEQNISWNSLRRKSIFFSTTIKKKTIFLLLQQLSHLIASNINLLSAIRMLKHNYKSKPIFSLLNKIEIDICAGHTLYETFKKHPNYFSELTCHLIHLGEVSGNLSTILQNIVLHQEKMYALKTKLIKALFYPSLILFFSCAVTFFLLSFIVPQFAEFYASVSGQLPFLTQQLIIIANFLHAYSLTFFSLCIILLISILLMFKKIPLIQHQAKKLTLHIPLFGKFLQIIILLRFLQALNLSMSSGLPIINALSLIKKICAYPSYENLLTQATQKIAEGHSIAESLQHEKYIPNFVIELIRTGEASGSLSAMLDQAAHFYEAKLDTFTYYLQILLEPLLLTFLSVMIGFILLALYLPIFNIGNVI